MDAGGRGRGRIQSIAPRDELHLLDQGESRRRGGLKSLQVGDQGRGILYSLLPPGLQPLAADVGVRGGCNDGEDDEDDDKACFADARPAARPVDEPDECEGGCGGQDCAGGTESSDLEVRAGSSAISAAGEGGGTYAGLLAQQLRGDYEVAKVLEEAFVVGASEA